MPTYYVSDYDGKREDDAAEQATAETAAVETEQVTAKVVTTDSKAAPRSSRATTKDH